METAYEKALQDPSTARLIAEEAFVIDVLERICEFMEREAISRAELARRLGTSKANVTQMLRGRNLGVKTVAAAIHVMGGVPTLHIGRPVPMATSPKAGTHHFTVIDGEQTAWRTRPTQATYDFSAPRHRSTPAERAAQ